MLEREAQRRAASEEAQAEMRQEKIRCVWMLGFWGFRVLLACKGELARVKIRCVDVRVLGFLGF